MKPYDLSQLDLAPGAGFVGYSGAATYTAGTVGAALKAFAPTAVLTPGSVVFAGAGGALTQDNASLFFDDTNNRLGLGLAAPVVPLHIKSANEIVRLETTTARGSGGAAVGLWDPTGQKGWLGYGGSDLFQISNMLNSDMNFQVNNVERMRIYADGNFRLPGLPANQYSGITLQSKYATSSQQGFSYIETVNSENAQNGLLMFQQNINGSTEFLISLSPAGSRTVDRRFERFRIYADGDVAIRGNNIASSNGLQFQNTYASGSRNGTNYIDFRNELNIPGNSIGSNHFADGACELQIYTSYAGARNVDRRVMNSVFFGDRIFLNKNLVQVQADSYGGVGVTTGDSSHSGYVRFRAIDGSSLGYIGYVTIASGAHINYVSENAGTSGGHNFGNQPMWAGAYNPGSDRDLKTNIQPATLDTGAVIDAIEIVQFDWKDTGKHASVGLIAQDLYEILPEAVTPADEHRDSWAYDLGKMAMVMLAEIKALRARVAALEARP